MPSFIEFIETPQAFSLQDVLKENPEYIDTFIEYLTIAQDPMICNQRECYLYPSKTADILSQGLAYRFLVEKTNSNGQKSRYPVLQKLFENMNNEVCQPTLFGYCNKVLISLVKKTPQIYEFIKDNQNHLINLLKDDSKLSALKDFLSLFLIESTMQLYLFLKSMLIRNLIFRVVQEQTTGPIVYECINYFYQELLKAQQTAVQDQKQQLVEVCKNFQEQNLVTLLLLKIQASTTSHNAYIAQFLIKVCIKNQDLSLIIVQNMQTIFDFLQQYQDSSTFMQYINTQHISLIKLLVQLISLQVVTQQITQQIIKRLLVYSNVHSGNSFIHNLLFKAISCCCQQGKNELLNKMNIIPFMIKSQTIDKYAFMGLRKRIFVYWVQHKLIDQLQEQEKEYVLQVANRRKEQISKSNFYKDLIVSQNNAEMELTKMPKQEITSS